MKPKTEKGNPWEGSNLVSRVEPVGEGVIPWADLTKSQRDSFVASFLAPEAIDERMQQLKPLRQHNHDTFLAGAIRLHRFNVQHGLDEPILEAILKDMLFGFFELGYWGKLEWLIEYGKAHYPQGFMGAETTISEINPMDREDHINNISTTFMLCEFSRLSGIDLICLAQPIKIVDDAASLPSAPFNLAEVMALNSAGFPPPPPAVLPKGLPTKSLLDSATLEAWERYNGDKSLESVRTTLSRERKRFGLDNLPKGKPRR
jgi:hypothetical protein